MINRIKKEFKDTPDLIIKEIKINFFKSIYIVYLETVSSSNKINDYILKNIIGNIKNINEKNIFSYLASPNDLKIDNSDQIEFYLTNGYTIVLINKLLIAVETKADINRAISTPEVQPSINGPKDSFTENYQINIGLIKRRIKSNTLKIKNVIIGRKTKTNIGILYFDDIADDVLVKTIISKLNTIDIDGIIDSSEIAHFLDGEAKSSFPTILKTERPDSVATALLEGKIAIVIDTTPFVLIMPSFFIDFINPTIDDYSKNININFIKLLRFFSFFITIMAPGIYIALINYNQEAIPTKLLLNFATQREGVPFPAFFESIVMLIICEILRESDLRFPSSYGSAISILGALVLGEASVKAGIVSPIMIIVIALTFISSLIFTDVDMVNALRHYRFLFLIMASILGIYGVTLSFFFLLIKLVSTYSFNKVYSSPLAPFDKNYFFKKFIKKQDKNLIFRSKLFTNKNFKRKD